MEIKDILKPEELRDLKQFSEKEREWLNKRIKNRKDGKSGVECVVRDKNSDGDYFELKPEETVRQLYAHRLIEEYGYSKDQLDFEVPAVYAGCEIIKDKRIRKTCYCKLIDFQPYYAVACFLFDNNFPISSLVWTNTFEQPFFFKCFNCPINCSFAYSKSRNQ